MQYSLRLRRGDDLRGRIEAFAREHAIEACVPIACVGCLSSWRMRGADGQTAHEGKERVEIVSLTGTVSRHGCHLHIALAREDLSVIGGHLLEGCIVNTTAEIVLCVADNVRYTRALDDETGYKELTIEAL